MKKYRIIAKCDPYNARSHYHGEDVIKFDGATPTAWVIDDFYGKGLSLEEARGILDGYANQLNDNTFYYDDASIAQWKDELEKYDEEMPDFSWYRGAGWYENNECVYYRGEDYLRDDVMTYSIEEMPEPKYDVRSLYRKALAESLNDVDNGVFDFYEMQEMVKVFEKVVEDGEELDAVYTLGTNSIIDRVLEEEGIIEGMKWL